MKVCVIVQSTHENEVRKALADAGAGVIGEYRACQFITRGEAQFFPTTEADPAVGGVQKMNLVVATKIETWCNESEVERVIQAVKEAHPNEEPGVEIYPYELR